jgi:hypothetical protein
MDDLRTPSADEGLHKSSMFLARSVLGLIPGIGGLANEVLSLVVVDPAQRRRDAFILDIAQRLEALERAGLLTIDDLAADERVSAIILTAVQVAQRSTGQEKLNGLKAATMRGIATVAERDRATIAIGIIDRLTDPHIIGLSLFAQAEGELEAGAVWQFFRDHIEADPPRGLDPSDPFFPVIWRDLIAQGLVSEKVLSGYGAGGTVYVISPLGRFVIEAISSDT